MRWIDDLGTWWKAEVEIWRTGTYGSPADHFRVDADGDRNDAEGARYEGEFFTETRRAYFGNAVSLAGADEGEYLRITAAPPVDPMPTSEYEPPPAGTRYVGVPLAVENAGEGRSEEFLRNDARLVLSDGTTLEPDVIVSGPCQQGVADVHEGRSRQLEGVNSRPVGQRKRDAALSGAVMESSRGGSPTRRSLDCDDFGDQADAQRYFEDSGPGDPFGLDADNDGKACEDLEE